MRTRLISTIAATTIAVSSFGIGAVNAAAPESTPPESANAERVCNRVDNLIARVNNMIDRINGDDQTRGSLLWLDRRIANAVENDREDLAEVLRNRRATREGFLPLLDDRLATLRTLDARCAEAGL